MRQKAENRVQNNKETHINIIWNLPKILHEKNNIVKSYKHALQAHPAPKLTIKVNLEMRHSREHSWQYNSRVLRIC